MALKTLLTKLLPCAALMLTGCSAIVDPPKRWTLYFGETPQPELLKGYDMVVLDLDAHPPIAPIQAVNTRVLAYIAASEIGSYRSYASQFASVQGLVLGTNPRWGGAIVDIRNHAWQEFVVNVLVAKAMQQGFDGVFIDTLDTSLHLESQSPENLSGTTEAATRLLTDVRRALPEGALLVVNRAFPLLEKNGHVLDGVVAESIALVETEAGQAVDYESYQRVVALLLQQRKKNPHLHIYTLDYPDVEAKTLQQELWCMHRSHAFSPMFGNYRLQTLPFGLEDAERFNALCSQQKVKKIMGHFNR